jgi:hypothetical protein
MLTRAVHCMLGLQVRRLDRFSECTVAKDGKESVKFSSAAEMAVDAFMINDAYYPLPDAGELWQRFQAAYGYAFVAAQLEQSAERMTELHLFMEEFLEGVKKQAPEKRRKRQSKHQVCRLLCSCLFSDLPELIVCRYAQSVTDGPPADAARAGGAAAAGAGAASASAPVAGAAATDLES